MSGSNFGSLLSDSRPNAIAAWALVGLFALTIVEGIATGDYLWSAFAAVVGFVAATPAVTYRDPLAMPPWEIVLVAGLPVVGRAVATFSVTSDVATYISIAALALLVAVNLHLFTAIEMNVGFAVLFVVVTTVAAAGVWAVARWGADVWLGTELLYEPGLAQEEIERMLMWEFVGASVAGLVAGLFFEGYVHRRTNPGSHAPAAQEEGAP